MELTQEEKIRLIFAVGMWHTYDCNGKLTSIMMCDGPYGLRKQDVEKTGQNNDSIPATCFPTESAVACSFDPQLIALMASTIANEALAMKVSIVLGCGVNIKRSPLCGRNFEYFSEDPFLAGTLACAYIHAMQEKGVAASLKHFACNNQETRRQTQNSQIDERAFREIYLPAFEMAVKQEKPLTVMASYNRINGTYACENKYLLTKILREEWGYQGCVVSDWGASVNTGKSILAGMDLEMPDSSREHMDELKNCIKNQKYQKALMQSADHVQRLVEEQSKKMIDQTVDYDLHDDIARTIAEESAVLLKNDGMLPISEQKIVIIGELAENMRFQGGGSSHINVTKHCNAIEAFKTEGYQVQYALGYHNQTDRIDEKEEKKALELVKSGVPVLYFCGLTEQYEGEGYDRKNLNIPLNQLHLLEEISKRNPNITAITFGGAPFIMPFCQNVRAILHMYLGGQAVAKACARLVKGTVNPSGKLAETFPLSEEMTPSYENFGKDTDDVEYRESIFVGYRYYDTYKKEVLFPFGYGMSYTKFVYSDLTVDREHYQGGEMNVCVKVKNCGAYDGKEVVQIYVKNPPCNYLRPKMELRGFQKIFLKAGEEKNVTICLSERSFSIYDETLSQFIMPSGEYEIAAAASSQDIRLFKTVFVNGMEYKRDDRQELTEYFSQTENRFHISKEQFAILYKHPLSQLDHRKRGEFTVYDSLDTLAKHSMIAKVFLMVSKKIVLSMFPEKKADDPEVMMIMQGTRYGTIDSVVCQSDGMVPYSVSLALVDFANGHFLQGMHKVLIHNRRKEHEK